MLSTTVGAVNPAIGTSLISTAYVLPLILSHNRAKLKIKILIVWRWFYGKDPCLDQTA